jgi:Holliday junction resolvasome RuvABC DNA-binding subunit
MRDFFHVVSKFSFKDAFYSMFHFNSATEKQHFDELLFINGTSILISLSAILIVIISK